MKNALVWDPPHCLRTSRKSENVKKKVNKIKPKQGSHNSRELCFLLLKRKCKENKKLK